MGSWEARERGEPMPWMRPAQEKKPFSSNAKTCSQSHSNTPHMHALMY